MTFWVENLFGKVAVLLTFEGLSRTIESIGICGSTFSGCFNQYRYRSVQFKWKVPLFVTVTENRIAVVHCTACTLQCTCSTVDCFVVFNDVILCLLPVAGCRNCLRVLQVGTLTLQLGQEVTRGQGRRAVDKEVSLLLKFIARVFQLFKRVSSEIEWGLCSSCAV